MDLDEINKITVEQLKRNPEFLEALYYSDKGIEDWDKEFEEFLDETKR